MCGLGWLVILDHGQATVRMALPLERSVVRVLLSEEGLAAIAFTITAVKTETVIPELPTLCAVGIEAGEVDTHDIPFERETELSLV